MEHHKHSYFLDLPVELRTLIYEFFFAHSEGSLLEWPPLLKVNQQIYKEGIAAHYAHTHFHFTLSTEDETFRIYSKLPSPYKTSISHLYCDEPCWRFSAKGAANAIHQIQRRAETELGTLPDGFIQAVMRAPGDSPVYTDDPVALARRMGWPQIDWGQEFRNRYLLTENGHGKTRKWSNKITATSLTLPTELRLNIYESLFGLCARRLGELPPILKANRQICKEAISLYYERTNFYFSEEDLDSTLQVYVRLPAHYRYKIKHLYFDEPYWHSCARGAAHRLEATYRKVRTFRVCLSKSIRHSRSQRKVRNSSDSFLTQKLHLGRLHKDFFQVGLQTPGTATIVYTSHPQTLAKQIGWEQVDWSEFRGCGLIRKWPDSCFGKVSDGFFQHPAHLKG